MANTTTGNNGGGCCHFLLQVITGRWFMMFASFLIMAGAGATYLFGVYSKDIKATLGYDQSTLNLMSTFKDLGANVGVLSGLLAEVAPTWFVLLIGSVMNFAGYFMIWVMKISTHPNELKVFYQYLSISIVLALLLMGLTIVQKNVTFSHIAYELSAVAVCIMLFLPFLIAVREEFYTWKNRKQVTAPTTSSTIVEAPPAPETASKSEIEPEFAENKIEQKNQEASGCANICKRPKRGEDYSICQALLSIDMLLLFVGTFCGLGCSLTAVDNLGQIGESLGYPHQTVSTFVSLLSIWNYFGRVFAGFISEIILLKYKIPRPLIMAVALFVSAVGDILVSFPWPGSVYLASLLLGFSFGAQLTLLFIIVSELFGLKYYSTLFNCAQLASPLGSFVFNVKIVGKLYDEEALKQLAAKGITRSMVKELTCIGKQCYRLSFSILAAANIFGFIVTLILVLRTRKFYGGDIYKRFRDEMEANEKEMALKSAE
ncbi:hypothetical protein REPUB_Repub13aG0044800 [Reevesia pubescens]